jgi:hypothetical protein
LRTFLFIFFLFTSIGLKAQEEVVFIPEGGVHVGLKEVKIDIPEGFKVYYTKDGTPPTSSHSRVRKSLSVYGNTAFRFLIYDDKGNKTNLSQSYFTERKHTLPIVSITIDTIDFSDSIQGIYAMGCCADTIDPHKGANFWKDWEKPIHIEFIEKDNRQVINQDAGIKIFGGFSVSMPQKSLAIYARKKYGENRFRHQLFPQLPFDKYKNFVLRNAGGDMLMAHMRDVYASQLVKETGIDCQEYRPVSVYINGRYWGKYNLREKINEHYINAHYGYDEDSIIIMRHQNAHQHGSTEDYDLFISKVPELDLNKKEDLSYLHSKMDIQNYILYNVCEVYTGNKDAGGNIRYYKHTSDTAKWRWIFYDLDMGLNFEGSDGYKRNSVIDFTTYKDEKWPNPPWSTLIIRKILENDSLKHEYINHFSDLLNTTFQSEKALKLIDSLATGVSKEIDYHLERWGISRTRYDNSVENLRVFAQKRPALLRQFLRERFDLSEDLYVKVVVPKGGHVLFNSFRVKESFEGIYYKGVPLNIEAVPKFDYEFIGWNELTELKKKDYASFNKDTLVLEPIFEKRSRSEFAGKIMITEIDATQSEKDTFGDWVELYNISEQLIDVSNWILKDNKDNHHFELPEGTEIKPHTFLIITEDSATWRLKFKDEAKLVGNIPFGINKTADKIRLYDNQHKKVDEINLKKLEQIEGDHTNWSKIDIRIVDFSSVNWQIESSSPNAEGLDFKRILQQEEEDEFLKSIFFYSGISLGGLVVLLFLFTLLGRRNKTNS